MREYLKQAQLLCQQGWIVVERWPTNYRKLVASKVSFYDAQGRISKEGETEEVLALLRQIEEELGQNYLIRTAHIWHEGIYIRYQRMYKGWFPAAMQTLYIGENSGQSPFFLKGMVPQRPLCFVKGGSKE